MVNLLNYANTLESAKYTARNLLDSLQLLVFVKRAYFLL